MKTTARAPHLSFERLEADDVEEIRNSDGEHDDDEAAIATASSATIRQEKKVSSTVETQRKA